MAARLLILLSCSSLLLAACIHRQISGPTPLPEPQVQVVAENLLAPVGMTRLPGGSLLVAEEGTGERDDSAGVVMITPDGDVGRLISGLPSSRDSGDLAGANRVTLAPDGRTIYIANFGPGHLWSLPLTETQQIQGLSLPETPLTSEDLTPTMLPLNNVRLVNPFGITFDEEGIPVVSDASGNGLAKETPEGTTRFFHRFAQLPNPAKASDRIDPVPTGITRVEDEYYVTLFGGCPYPEGGGRLVAVDEERNQRTVLDGLNLPIDVARDARGTIWLLEFARFKPDVSCFEGTGYQARTGQLSRLHPDGSREIVLTGLNFPGAVLPVEDGSLYISETFTGRILHVTFGSTGNEPSTPGPSRRQQESSTIEIEPEAYDARLQEVIQERGLAPYPGVELRESDSPLVRLGQELFFDPILSGDRNISCATCHHPSLAMGDARVLPIGTGGTGLGPQRTFTEEITLGPEASYVRQLAGKIDRKSGKVSALNPFVGAFVPRNSLSILNSALLPKQFWDSRVEGYANGSLVRTKERLVTEMEMTDALATQALFPIASLHEMAGATFGALPPHTIRQRLLDRLRETPAYVERFEEVFGEGKNPEEAVTLARLVEALAAFERRFIFTDAPWDRYLDGDTESLSARQKRGALLFFGQIKPEVNCASCHSGNLFTDLEHHNLLVPQLGPGKGHGYTKREDWGRAGVTFDPRDRYKFRTPTLRNVELTAPYFHTGAYPTLADTIRHHADIWNSARTYDPSRHSIPPALYSSLRPFEPEKQWFTAAPELRYGLPLTENDIADLVDFLTALTDPAARELSQFVPERVPSELPLDRPPEALHRTSSTALRSPGVTIPDNKPEPDTEGNLNTPRLVNVAAQVGLSFRHGAFQTAIFDDPVAAMGGGLCWIDYNNDRWLDLYVVNSHTKEESGYWKQQGGLPQNKLFRNDGGTFTDVSLKSGTNLAARGNGCTAADFNGDGWMDLYITADGPNALLWNNGDSTFTEGAAAAGVAAPEWNSAAAATDLDGNGYPDLYVAAYIDLDHKIPKPIGAFPQDYYGLPDRLYLNNGPINPKNPASPVTFTEVTADAGLMHEERGLGALFSDLNNNGRMELHIANDGQPNRLYTYRAWPGGVDADPKGLGFRLADVTETAEVGDTGSGMGVAAGDYSGDGQIDLFVTNWERELNALYRNQSREARNLSFEYSTFRIGISGLGNGMTGWGTHFLDIDHDTDLDLLFVNGRVPVTNMQRDAELVRLYRNRSRKADGGEGRPGQFIEWSDAVGLQEVGSLMARGSAAADFDNDGDLDIAINSIAGDLALLRNDGAKGNWLIVQLDGFYPGARATVELPDGRHLVRELYAGSSYLASEDPRFHFGLARETRIERLEIRLPDGSTLTYRDLPVNQILRVNTE